MTPEEIAEKILKSTGGYLLRHKRASEAIRTAIREACEADAKICDECKDQYWGPIMAAAIRARDKLL